MVGEGENWENFCEQKFSQTLSKNFDWGTCRVDTASAKKIWLENIC